MTSVLIPYQKYKDEWRKGNVKFDIPNRVYHYHCGLTIPVENITTTGNDDNPRAYYVIYFEEEKDAIWFVLALGGEIVHSG